MFLKKIYFSKLYKNNILQNIMYKLEIGLEIRKKKKKIKCTTKQKT
jgi:hypothetical protein